MSANLILAANLSIFIHIKKKSCVIFCLLLDF